MAYRFEVWFRDDSKTEFINTLEQTLIEYLDISHKDIKHEYI